MKSERSHERRERARKAVAVVGVDAGKFQHAMVVRPHGRPDSKAFLFATTRLGFESAVQFIHDLIGPDFRAREQDEEQDEILVGIEFAGMYGFTFAQYLRALGDGGGPRFEIVSILPAHTKRWKEVTHRQPLKTDAKDAVGIADLTAYGHYVSFPFLAPAYAELHYLLSVGVRVEAARKMHAITLDPHACELVGHVLRVAVTGFVGIIGDEYALRAVESQRGAMRLGEATPAVARDHVRESPRPKRSSRQTALRTG